MTRVIGQGEGLSLHVPIRAQAAHHVILGTNHIGWQAADPVVTHADIIHVSVRNTSPVTADATRITASILVLEPRWRSKVQTSVSSRFTQGMAKRSKVSKRSSEGQEEKQRITYALGITARSSNDDIKGV